jgi:RNA polymerase sigma-70 factor (ECF subfamily)
MGDEQPPSEARPPRDQPADQEVPLPSPVPIDTAPIDTAPIEPRPYAPPGAAPGLEALYREHCERVFAAAFRVTGDPMDAEDVLQTVFLRLLRRRQEPDLGGTAGAYLHRAAVNAALDALRRRRRRGPEVRLEPADEGAWLADDAAPGPERERRARELGTALRGALTRLSPAAAEVFALRYLEGWPNQEIAHLLGMTQTAVAVSLHRTRRRLQRELAHHRGV